MSNTKYIRDHVRSLRTPAELAVWYRNLARAARASAQAARKRRRRSFDFADMHATEQHLVAVERYRTAWAFARSANLKGFRLIG